jgi:hypothetical protein
MCVSACRPIWARRVWSCLGELLVESAHAHRDTETAAARPSSTPLNLKRLTLDP